MIETRYLVLHSAFVIKNWEALCKDKYFPDVYKDADEFLRHARAGGVVIGGAKVIIRDNLPEV